MRISNAKRGSFNQRIGEGFENYFRSNCEFKGVTVTRIPNGCRTVGNRLVRVKSPFDWVITYKGKTVLIDTKTVMGNSWVPSDFVSAKTEHQYAEMMSHWQSGGSAGYAVWLRQSNEVVYIPVSMLKARTHILLGRVESFNPLLMF